MPHHFNFETFTTNDDTTGGRVVTICLALTTPRYFDPESMVVHKHHFPANDGFSSDGQREGFTMERFAAHFAIVMSGMPTSL